MESSSGFSPLTRLAIGIVCVGMLASATLGRANGITVTPWIWPAERTSGVRMKDRLAATRKFEEELMEASQGKTIRGSSHEGGIPQYVLDAQKILDKDKEQQQKETQRPDAPLR